MKIHVAHILFEQKFEADDVLRKLQDGADFFELAKKYSKCPSSSQGGDLGIIDVRRLDPDFVDAATVIKVGQISPIVRTRFGYHLIKKMTEDLK